MSTITEMLSRKREEIKRPPLPPVGHYRFKIYRKHEMRDSADGKWSFLEIYCQAVAAQPDVDEEELQEYGRAVENIRLRHSFIYGNDPESETSNEDTNWRVQEFCKQCDVEADEETSLMEQVADLPEKEFIGKLVLNPDKNNPEIRRPQISRTLALTDVPDYL